MANQKQADELLQTHLEIAALSSEAASLFPPVKGEKISGAVDRAIHRTSERILASLDRPGGLTADQALIAQRQLHELVTLLAAATNDPAAGNGNKIRGWDRGSGNARPVS